MRNGTICMCLNDLDLLRLEGRRFFSLIRPEITSRSCACHFSLLNKWIIATLVPLRKSSFNLNLSYSYLLILQSEHPLDRNCLFHRVSQRFSNWRTSALKMSINAHGTRVLTNTLNGGSFLSMLLVYTQNKDKLRVETKQRQHRTWWHKSCVCVWGGGGGVLSEVRVKSHWVWMVENRIWAPAFAALGMS